ncbi:fasciclin domain-containing protein [Methylobacterium sp. J-068]|nr:fasciclin domain-containing protein [Methylobacterium sp. J-068]MCJ2037152.1 fasciclin domain-containing protein [Methylobacterium sp. J-068]
MLMTTITRTLASAALAFTLGAAVPAAALAKNPMVGGAPMYASKNIVENAVNSKDHTTLVAAVKAAGLVDTLASPGPFTVFAPTNAAFAKLPAGTVETLVKPENKATLTKILTYHVVPGTYTAKDLMKLAKDGGGEAQLKTVEGEPLVIQSKGKKVYVTDAKGSTATVTVANVMQSNGVIHVINGVLQP